MFDRFWARLGLLLLAAGVPIAAQSAIAPPVTIPRIVAIGDLHGDYTAWRAIAAAAQLIDDKGRWAGGTTALVQTGDVADRGPDTLKIIQDLMRLQREAARVGGHVYALVGNHEAMNMTDDLRYVSAAEYAAFADRNSAALRDEIYRSNKAEIEAAYRKTNPAMTSEAIQEAWIAVTPLGMIEHQRAWHPAGKIGSWVIGNPAVLLLNGTLFVHGGISAAYATRPIAEINQSVAAALTARETAPDAIINDPAGPLWYRGLVAGAASAENASKVTVPPGASPVAQPLTIEAELNSVLAAYGAQRMVIAHTPILTGIATLYDGRLIRIDTGISAVYGGKLTYLEIIDGKPLPHEVPRPTGDK
jgi:hypothetical protein